MIDDIKTTDELKHIEPAPKDPAARDRAKLPAPVSGPSSRGELHPIVYKVIMGLAAWFALAVWGFVAPSGYTDVVLVIVSIFVFVAVALPFVLSRILRRRRGLDAAPERPGSLRSWLTGDLDIWGARVKSIDAAAAILLPLLAGAVGMTAFAIVLHLAVNHAA